MSLALLPVGCTESILGYNGAASQSGLNAPPPTPTAPGLGVQDLAVPKVSYTSGHFGPDTSGSVRGVVYPGVAPKAPVRDSEAMPSAPDAGLAEANGDTVQAGPNGSYQLNFENADIAAVCKVIFADILKTNYIVDPRVSGQISLASSVPVPRSSLVPLLENALLAANAAIFKEDGAYRITPMTDPGGLRRADYNAAGEGYGVTVIGSKFISASSVARLLESYGSRTGTIKLDPASNLVIIQGTAAERRAALDAANMLDVDWLRAKSVAILPLKNTTPEQVIPQINRILDTGQGGLSEDMVKMQPLSGLNAILAVARNRPLIDKVTTWTRRLDQQDYAALSLKTYHLQYAQAKTVAAVLNNMFGGGSNGAPGQSDKDQLAPRSQSNDASGGAGSGGGIGGSSSPSSPMASSSGTNASAPSGGGFGSMPGQSGSTASSGDNQSNPFGALKTSVSFDNNGADDSKGASQVGPNGSRVHVTADLPSNTLFIYADRPTYGKIERAIRDIDRAPTQVDIDVTIAEVTLTKDLQFGVQAYLNSRNGSGALAMTNGSTGGNGTSTPVQPGIPLTTMNPGVNLLVGAVANPRVVINALSNVTNVKVLSSPSLVVADRQAARLEVGDQVPVLAQQAVSTQTAGAPVVNSVNYVNTGIILNVLPSVNANGIVSLQVQQEISSVTNPGTASDPNLTPTISQRTVRSNVSVRSGQTVLLAGLIQDQRTETRSGLPGVGDIPIVSQLLTNHESNIQRDELIIFIRPRIIHNSSDAEQFSDEFRSRLQSMQPQLADRIIRKP